MKATELIKKPSVSIEDLYEKIKEANDAGAFKILIPHFQYIPDSWKLEFISNGFKVYTGEWNTNMNGTIIEW